MSWARAAWVAQSSAGLPERDRGRPHARSESIGIPRSRLDSIHRAARSRGSAVDDQPSGSDWSKSKPGSSSQGRSGDESPSRISGSARGAPSGGAREGMSRHSRIRRATSGSVIADRIRIRPSHWGQRSASTSNTLCNRSAQAMRLGGGGANAGSAARVSAAAGPGSITGSCVRFSSAEFLHATGAAQFVTPDLIAVTLG